MSESTTLCESPFVDVRSFEVPPATAAKRLGLTSPFVEAFAFEHSAPEADDPAGAPRRVLLAELFDEELDDAVYELVGEAASYASAGTRSAGPVATLHFQPLADEIDAFLRRAADELGARDAASFVEGEIDDVLRRIEPERQLAPVFEQFFGAIKKAVSRVAKGAVSLARKGVAAAASLGLGPIIAKLRKLVPDLIRKVIAKGTRLLPAALQPAAAKLAGNLPALFGYEAEDGLDDPAIDVSPIQREFNEQVAGLLLGGDGVDSEQEMAGWRDGDAESAADIADLDAARDRFVADLEQLADGDDAGPAVERFVPALLPAVRLGIRLAGRKRVVNLLAGLVSKLIGRFVGPASAGALSTALVDAGFKLLGLEVAEGDRRRTAQAAVAATVEETVRRAAALPDAVLDNEMLLEGSILQAFEEAAAANLPPLLPDAVYRRRPDLIETDGRRGTWIPCPVRGPKRYKKFSRVFKTRITPRLAMSVTTFGEAPLAEFLQEQLGFEPGEDVEAEVSVYESLPGTQLNEVARLEGNGRDAARSAEFHPLTPQAAALLLGEPGLGRQTSAASLSAPRHLAVGQRFYRLGVPGRRVSAIPGTGARGRLRRRTSVHTVLDFPGDQVRLYLFLSERRAQELAAALRKQGHAGTVATTLKGHIDRGLAAAANGNVTGRLKLVHEALTLAAARGGALGHLPKSAVRAFTSQIGSWTLSALTDFLSSQPARFIAATEDARDGVTVVVALANAPGMAAMRKAVAGAPPNGGAAAGGAPASIKVDVVPGFTNG